MTEYLIDQMFLPDEWDGYKSCSNCTHSLPIGQGDFICDVDGKEQERGLVISDYIDSGMPCEGKDWCDGLVD